VLIIHFVLGAGSLVSPKRARQMAWAVLLQMYSSNKSAPANKKKVAMKMLEEFLYLAAHNFELG
jgi:hypothetical protein